MDYLNPARHLSTTQCTSGTGTVNFNGTIEYSKKTNSLEFSANQKCGCCLYTENYGINYHIIREAVAAGIIRVGKEDTLTNIADVFMKLVPFTRKYQLLSPFLWDG